ncbi:hypothetical protein N7508_011030 [Penicillium antarcticum]|uniref:uncharacterized protein n=1 Tax=Penicillium antarcticum TaxID=416450 RepID=UPI00239BB274|nr:uncharacterized protein N7508_011030 [Penicillium antarcticum]KAJ5296209.1 hypothetical protein N7508_011030 [Penicillium antarcticum]
MYTSCSLQYEVDLTQMPVYEGISYLSYVYTSTDPVYYFPESASSAWRHWDRLSHTGNFHANIFSTGRALTTGSAIEIQGVLFAAEHFVTCIKLVVK